MTSSLADALADKEILVVCGSGGVGKTSLSAALGLAAAREQRAIVVTIDPAKRLASALGVEGGLAHEVSEIDVEGGGRLDASMLDMKSAWDQLVDKYAPSRQVARDIKTNRLYQGLSEHFVGSQGYMAMEQLADLHERGRYDLIVVDTPPTRHALDFLDAPKRMTDFVGGSLLKWFAKPYASAGKLGLKAFNFTASPFLRIADRVLGSEFLEDLSRFVLDFQSIYEDFKERAEEVYRLLADERTGFVVATTLEGPPFREAGFFIDRLADEGMPLSGVIANKVIPQRFVGEDVGEALDALADPDGAKIAEITETDPDAAADTLEQARRALVTLSDLARRDASRLTELEQRTKRPVAAVPLFTTDVHDLESLNQLVRYVLSSPDDD